MADRPRSREKNVIQGSASVHKHGSGLGTGPSGSGGGFSGGSSGGGGKRAAIGGGIPLVLIIIVLYFLFGGKIDDSESYEDDSAYTEDTQSGSGASFSQNNGSVDDTGYEGSSFETYSADLEVAEGARDKRTVIKGDGSDIITIMVYMCGTDLESKSAMASNDMAEMARASFDDNINLIVYTGGCKKWRTQGISSDVNQIYQIKDGGLTRLVDNDGSKKMTDPDTLSSFIRYCSSNFPANRNELIFWDHGGGSVSGFGYDEKFKQAGSMNLSQIKKALSDGGVKFDIIGFDACLMGSAETAVMLDEFSDYMIASEETEPGVGWYYTNWLTALSKDPAMPSVEIGKRIIDDYTNVCMQKVNNQKTTLSIIDLAEFNCTVTDKLKGFSNSVSSLVNGGEYKKVANARYDTREFNTNSRIDQVDLYDLASNIGTPEANELCEAIEGAVKYNRTSYNMTNAHGVSVYFPYNKTSYVDKAVDTFEKIGMDQSYTRCIRETAAMQTGGQIYGGGSNSPFGSLSGDDSDYTYTSADIFGSLLSSFLSDRSISVDGLDKSNTKFMEEDIASSSDTAEYISMNYLDQNSLFWTQEDGEYILSLSESQWELVHDVDLNMFYDDGAGYIDLGLDNIFSFNDNGDLVADTEGTWLCINRQIIPYYHTDTTEGGNGRYTITGFVPVLLNKDKAKLILMFTDEKPNGYIAGAVYDYDSKDTDTSAKSLDELNIGDELQFVCDYYSYDGKYIDSYLLGDKMTVSEDMEIADIHIDNNKGLILYRFTDIYNAEYWTPSIEID